MARSINTLSLSIVALVLLATVTGAEEQVVPCEIKWTSTFEGPANYYYMQTRGTLIPGEQPSVLLTTQEIEKQGAHGFRDVFQFETRDLGRTWSGPKRIENLNRAKRPDGYEVVIGDLCPAWHAASGVVLATGKTFNFADGVKENRGREQVSYTVYSPRTDSWSGLQIVDLPATDHEGQPFSQPNSGCCQRCDLPGGEILLPIRYCKLAGKLNYTTIVARCKFDGSTLKYVEHGSELGLKQGRGLYEPSIISHQGQYYLTLRGDASAFVARSKDGLNYDSPVEWKYDDGSVLGSYNTQQHWVQHSTALYLVYTRRGANNDHVFRHRAPLFIAQVDPARLCVMRATEQILIPENQADLGNFGVCDISADETWVIASEQLTGTKRKNERNQTWIGQITWPRANSSK